MNERAREYAKSTFIQILWRLSYVSDRSQSNVHSYRGSKILPLGWFFRYCHVRPLLYNLHWLPVKFRIVFKILLLTYKPIDGLAHFYIQELINLEEACKYKLRSECDGLLLNLVKIKTLTTLGDRSFIAATAPQLLVEFTALYMRLGVAPQ